MAFLGLGMNEFIDERADNRTPRKNMVWGRVMEMNSGEVIIKEGDGRIVRVEMKNYENPGETWPDARGKILRAIGERKDSNLEYFHAESVLCCDED
jgi:hypothetical protein